MILWKLNTGDAWDRIRLILFALTIALVSNTAHAQNLASSVSQYGITWYFDGAHEVGRYANGDWWVLGPVTITRITPESKEVSGRWINGTMVNPTGSTQGYDSSVMLQYSGALNRNPAVNGKLTLSTGSVVSGVSGAPASGSGPALDELAILTVVSEVPPLGAFRPHPYGTDKTSYWKESQLDYSILQSLSPVAGLPDMASAVASQIRFWNEQFGHSWQQNGSKARNAQGGGYGRELARWVGDRALMLHLDLPTEDKRDLFVALVQYGLDIYGRVLEGGYWSSDGGINHGRKLPLVLAGLALGDSDVLFWADRDNAADIGLGFGYNLFQEDGSTFFITQGDIDRSNYTQADLGLPEWSTRYWQYFSATSSSSSNLDGQNGWPSGSYRYVGSQYVAHALAMRLTEGGLVAWNWPPFFDYADRFQELGGVAPVGNTNGVSSFTQSMWNAYRDYVSDSGEKAPPRPPELYTD